MIAAAAEKQSGACEEALKTVAQQATALSQGDQATSELSTLAEDLKNATDVSKAPRGCLNRPRNCLPRWKKSNRAATEIMAALDLINGSATQQSSGSAQSMARSTRSSVGQGDAAACEGGHGTRPDPRKSAQGSASSVDHLIAGVSASLDETNKTRDESTR